MRAPLLVASAAVVVVAVACGGGPEPQTASGVTPIAPASTSATAAPCVDAPNTPTDAMAKEPAVFNACLASAGKLDPNVCGFAKIAVQVNKDGRISHAEVAQSTLPAGVTDCLKARVAALQLACPKEGSASYTIPVGLPVGSATSGACPGLPTPPPPAG